MKNLTLTLIVCLFSFNMKAQVDSTAIQCIDNYNDTFYIFVSDSVVDMMVDSFAIHMKIAQVSSQYGFKRYEPINKKDWGVFLVFIDYVAIFKDGDYIEYKIINYLTVAQENDLYKKRWILLKT